VCNLNDGADQRYGLEKDGKEGAGKRWKCQKSYIEAFHGTFLKLHNKLPFTAIRVTWWNYQNSC